MLIKLKIYRREKYIHISYDLDVLWCFGGKWSKLNEEEISEENGLSQRKAEAAKWLEKKMSTAWYSHYQKGKSYERIKRMCPYKVERKSRYSWSKERDSVSLEHVIFRACHFATVIRFSVLLNWWKVEWIETFEILCVRLQKFMPSMRISSPFPLWD